MRKISEAIGRKAGQAADAVKDGA
uniref:Uncharacterized protein n=1 Tax=Caenorhabditis japonica TaxID=281687 RepID=A0A8R1EE49_CAEJA